jgi:hypothetical protein
MHPLLVLKACGSAGGEEKALVPGVVWCAVQQQRRSSVHDTRACATSSVQATCYGGRNRLVAAAWTKAQLVGPHSRPMRRAAQLRTCTRACKPHASGGPSSAPLCVSPRLSPPRTQEGKPRTFEDLEADLLKGQKLQVRGCHGADQKQSESYACCQACVEQLVPCSALLPWRCLTAAHPLRYARRAC